MAYYHFQPFPAKEFPVFSILYYSTCGTKYVWGEIRILVRIYICVNVTKLHLVCFVCTGWLATLDILHFLLSLAATQPVFSIYTCILSHGMEQKSTSYIYWWLMLDPVFIRIWYSKHFMLYLGKSQGTRNQGPIRTLYSPLLIYIKANWHVLLNFSVANDGRNSAFLIGTVFKWNCSLFENKSLTQFVYLNNRECN